MVNKFRATFITMFDEPIASVVSSSIIGRAQRNDILSIHIESILKSVAFNHHKVDDTPYGGGPGELMKINVIAPLIKQALERHADIPRANKRVLLMDPAGTPFSQDHAKRLSTFDEIIFVCGRYEGIDARVHNYVDEALSLGDFVLSCGDLAAVAIFDATARMIEGVLGNHDSTIHESHFTGRLEGSHYTRPQVYEGHEVPPVFQSGNHAAIEKERMRESLERTIALRPDLIKKNPLTEHEQKLLRSKESSSFPWKKPHAH